MKWQGNDREGWRLEARGLVLRVSTDDAGDVLWWINRANDLDAKPIAGGRMGRDETPADAKIRAIDKARSIAHWDYQAWVGALGDALDGAL